MLFLYSINLHLFSEFLAAAISENSKSEKNAEIILPNIGKILIFFHETRCGYQIFYCFLKE